MSKKTEKVDDSTSDKIEELYSWKISQSFESDQEVIGFFRLCAYQNDSEKAAKYDQVDVLPLNEELKAAFASWEIEEDWEANDFDTFQCADRKTPGAEKVLKIYNGYDNRLLNCRPTNLDEAEKDKLVSLLNKYYNHVSSDFDINKAVIEASQPEPEFHLFASAPEGEITREYLEENWAVSSYNEDEECQIDYYINELHNCPGDKAYIYSHEDDELRQLEIVHIIARSDNPDAYEELLEDDDVLINGEEEYGADTSAEFITQFDCYLVWFKEIEE